MRKHLIRSLLSASVALAFTVVVFGQFPAESTIPKSKRGKNRRLVKGPPGPTPKFKDGTVNLQGVWGYAGYTSDIAKDYDVGELPMTPLGNKLFLERQANEGKDDPEARCLPTGVPRRDPYPFKIVQTPELIAILYEGNIHSFRQIHLDGRKHLEGNDFEPTFYGDSIGKFNGDVLEVDTMGFKPKLWLDMAGHPASDELHVAERFSRPDYGTLKWNFTITDPVMYTRPWEVTETMPLMEKAELYEYICTENNKDVEHLEAIPNK